jgi:Family of unknown function (DUF6112)
MGDIPVNVGLGEQPTPVIPTLSRSAHRVIGYHHDAGRHHMKVRRIVPALVVALGGAALTAGPASADVTVTPDAAAPGGTQLGQLINYVGFYAELACLAAVLLGSIIWAVGSHGGNYQASAKGKTTVISALGVALLIGAAAVLVNTFLHIGQQVA